MNYSCNFLYAVGLILACGCSTSPIKSFETLHPGSDKGIVLEAIGSPQRTQRWHGMDRWTYILYDENQRQEREIHFLEGRAVYLGSSPTPKISAAEQDDLNERSNATRAAEEKQHQQEGRQAYQQFQSEADGTDEVRYVPQFEPVK